MADPLAELLNPTDLGKFASSDQSWFLSAAGEAIRDFCGWHIAPSLTLTAARVRLGERGLIILPSMHVTDVASVTVGEKVLAFGTDYDWIAPSPTIRRLVASFPYRNQYATVTYTHGFAEVPKDVAAVGYELVQQGRSRPGANSKDMAAGTYRITMLKVGTSLDDDQKGRLWAAGVVRPQIA